MRRGFLLFCLLLGGLGSLYAQQGYGAQKQTWAVGVMAGGANYLGDIGREHQYFEDMQFTKTRYAFGAYTRYRLRLRVPLYLRGSITYSSVAGDDELAKDKARYYRNLSFRSTIVEMAGMVEWSFWKYVWVSGGFGAGRKNEVRAWIFGGIAGFYFNPKTKYQGEWVNLQPLGTEGQGAIEGKKKYSRFQPSFPFGGEIEYSWRPLDFRIGLEVGWRYTLTDYIDDVSTIYADPDKIRQAHGETAAELSNRADEKGDLSDGYLLSYKQGEIRGDSSDNDTYGYVGFHFTYFLHREGRVMMPSFR